MTKDAAAENRQAWEKGDLKDCLELVRSAIAATIFYSKDADLKKSLQKTVNSINISLEAYGASLQPKEAEPTGEVELQAREKESAFLNEKINEKEAELLQAREEIEKLTQWKKEAMAVMPDFQEIGKLLNIKLGTSVSEQIIPKIKELKQDREVEGIKWVRASERFPNEGWEGVVKWTDAADFARFYKGKFYEANMYDVSDVFSNQSLEWLDESMDSTTANTQPTKEEDK
jgi:hypothetical protein